MSWLLTPDELASMRSDALGALFERCIVMRRDEPGAPLAEIAFDLPCRYVPANGREVDTGTGVTAGIDADATVRLPHDADVRRGDRLRIAGDGGEVLSDVVWTGPAARVHRNVLVRTVESA